MATKKQAVYQSGPKKGKLKPGYRYGKNGQIVAAKKSTSKKRRTRSKLKRVKKDILDIFK